MSDALGDDGSRAMEREVDTTFDGSCALTPSAMVLLSESELDMTLDLVSVAEWIVENQFLRIALQFPDGWLPISLRTVERLRLLCEERQNPESTNVIAARRLFVLGDTSYGSCCVDHVGAQHNGADCVVHFGPACLAPTEALPVAFVFGRAAVDVNAVAQAIQAKPDALVPTTSEEEEDKESIVIMYDLEYEHAAIALHAEISKLTSSQCSLARVEKRFRTSASAPPAAAPPAGAADTTDTVQQSSSNETQRQVVLGLQVSCDLNTARVLYVGSKSSPRLIQIVLQFPSAQVFVVDPTSKSKTDGQKYECTEFDSAASKTLRRRFFLTEKARDANIIGVLVGTMGIQGVNEALANIRAKVRNSGRKSYSFLVGKINPHKLANFDEIDVFVLIACPLNSLLDSKEFYKPIVTPYELDVALGLRDWNFSVPTDLTLLADEFKNHVISADADVIDDDADAPHFSLATGGMVQTRQYAVAAGGDDDNDTDGQQARDANTSTLTVPDQRHHIALRYSSPAAELLKMRSWGGLEPSIGETKATAATLGQTGTASGLSSITATQSEEGQTPEGISATGALT